MARLKKGEVITEAKPHTIKKFELIERYVDEWARKILGFQGKAGYEGSKGVIYIDCMCNSGIYRDISGNFVDGTALRVAKKLNEIITNYPGKHAVLIFNDLEEARVQYLKEKIESEKLENIEAYYYHGDCNQFLQELDLESYKRSYNTLLLYDPYNAAIDWNAIKPFLNRWGEVIINHMSSDTSRGVSQAKKSTVIERYENTYQQDIASLLDTNKDDLDKIIISIIRNNVTQAPEKYYISLAPFYNRTNGRVYSLIHCSANVEGIKLYKRVTWQTFGDRSSMKNTHGGEMQLTFDSSVPGVIDTKTDEQCYCIHDIAKFIYEKYNSKDNVDLSMIYSDLDTHPVFPSDGYKNDIKMDLKNIYGVKFPRDGKVIFPVTQGAAQ